jgi:AraC family ethanolamine operon transcriptional activator
VLCMQHVGYVAFSGRGRTLRAPPCWPGRNRRGLPCRVSLAVALAGQLKTLLDREGGEISETVLAAIEDQLVDVDLGMMPSTEVAEPLHRRARVALRLRDMLIGSLETPVSVSTMCEALGVKERTLYLTCVEAFGRPPKAVLLEQRLNVCDAC